MRNINVIVEDIWDFLGVGGLNRLTWERMVPSCILIIQTVRCWNGEQVEITRRWILCVQNMHLKSFSFLRRWWQFTQLSWGGTGSKAPALWPLAKLLWNHVSTQCNALVVSSASHTTVLPKQNFLAYPWAFRRGDQHIDHQQSLALKLERMPTPEKHWNRSWAIVISPTPEGSLNLDDILRIRREEII